VSCAETAESIDLPFGLWTWMVRRKLEFNRIRHSPSGASAHNFNRIHQVAPMCLHGRAHWRHTNTTEPSVYGGDAVLC